MFHVKDKMYICPFISLLCGFIVLIINSLLARRAIRHLDGKEYRGRPLVVEESRARPPNSTKVFVGNISATCSADDLHGLFASFGRVLDCDKVKGELPIVPGGYFTGAAGFANEISVFV